MRARDAPPVRRGDRSGPHQLLRAVGDLVAWSPQDPDYDVRTIVTLLVTGLRQAQPTVTDRA